MNIEQEGIELGTINPNSDEIILPDIETGEEEIGENGNTQPQEPENQEPEDNRENNSDEEKESLKRGINKERDLRKAAEKKNKELEEQIRKLENANKEPKKSTLDLIMSSSLIDEDVAKTIANAIDSNKTDTSSLEKEIAELKFKEALNSKSKEKGFEDILDYADEIKELVNKGLTVEQSYYASSYSNPSKNTKHEIERKVEAKMQNNNARKEILGNINSNVGASNNSKPKINISATERAVAAAAGMTAEEYAAIRDMNNVKDYSSYKGKKK